MQLPLFHASRKALFITYFFNNIFLLIFLNFYFHLFKIWQVGKSRNLSALTK